MLLQTTSHDIIGQTHDRKKNHELQHRNNSRRHRDHFSLSHVSYWRAACAGRSYPPCAGDYFWGKRISPGLGKSGIEKWVASVRGYS